jgi:hypothetical protein
MLAGNESERVGYYDEGGRFYEPPSPTPSPSGILNAVQNNDASSLSYANMPMGEAGRGGIPMQVGRPNPQMGIPMPKAPLPEGPSVQSEMNLPDPMNYGGGLTMQFGKPIIKDETFFEPFGRPYRKGFSDANQASDMVAPTMAPATLSSDGGRLQQMKADLSAMGFDPMGFSDADVMELHKLYVGGLVE